MSESRNQIYTEEFKKSTVKLALESEKPLAETARDLGVNKNTLYGWINKSSGGSGTGKSKGEGLDLYEENKRLRKEVSRLKEERDILKKAAAYFARTAS